MGQGSTTVPLFCCTQYVYGASFNNSTIILWYKVYGARFNNSGHYFVVQSIWGMYQQKWMLFHSIKNMGQGSATLNAAPNYMQARLKNDVLQY